jgi:predicted nucleotidyltransferase
MIAARDIEAVVDQIARTAKPERIILFGSYAYGTPNDDSDVDLMVIKRYRGDSSQAALRIRCDINASIPKDILVRSPAEIERRLRIEDFFIMDVVEKGLVLHERNNRRMGEQGRNRLRRRLHSATLKKAHSV